jgi:hypothetical protein
LPKKDKRPAIEDGAQRNSLTVDTAEPYLPFKSRARDPRPGDTAGWGYGAGWWKEEPFFDPATGLPANSPVTPLGKDGKVHWFIDADDQVIDMTVREFGRASMVSLFGGRVDYLMHHWPRFKDAGQGKQYIDTFKPEKVADDLMAACSAKGSWNDVESVRGRGAWRGFDGDLLVHCGDRILTARGALQLGEHNGFVYPARPALPGALNRPLTGRPGPGPTLLALLRSWNWRRPEVDPLLALGYIGAVFVSGALDWRPAIYAVGDKSTGKSHFQKLMKGVLSAWLVQSNDATAAGIYQRVKHDAIGVAIDELEGEKDPVKQKAIIKLMRVSSSGGLMLRGGSDHQGTEFNARSCFLFSSINTPPLEPQDLSRLGLLELKPLEDGAIPPALNDQELVLLGRAVLQKMLDNWSQWDERHEHWRQMLQRAGHKGRGQDTFGTLLTCADMILDTDAASVPRLADTVTGKPLMGPEAQDLTAWEKHFTVATMTEFEDDNPNWRLALNHILTTPVEAWRGGTRTTVGAMLSAFYADEVVKLRGSPAEGEQLTFDKLNRELASAGLAMKRPNRKSGTFHLFVPNQNPTLQRLFYGSKWYGELGTGVWAGALRQAPEEWVQTSQQGWISGVNARGCEIPLAKILEGFAEPGDQAEEKPAQSIPEKYIDPF